MSSVVVIGVASDTGEPLAGAPFTYRRGQGLIESALSEDGTARIELEGGGRIGGLRLERTDKYAGSNVEFVEVGRGEERVVTLTSTVGGTLKGVVVDMAGQGVAGAEVRVWLATRARAEADAVVFSEVNGAFEVLRVGPDFVAAARTESMACVEGLRGVLDASTRCEGLQLVVGPIDPLEGTVVDSRGQPIEGAHLKLGTGLNSMGAHQSTSVPGISRFSRLGGADQKDVITEADGRFVFKGQPAGQHQVRVERADFLGQWVTLDSVDSPVTVVLERGLKMRGRVYLPNGGPAEGARVRFSPRPQNTRAGGGSVETGPRGDFELSGLEKAEGETAHITVCLEGYAVAALNPPLYDSGQGESNEMRLEYAQPLAGIVRQSSGEPAEGIGIVLDGGRRFSSHDPFIGRIRSWESEADVDTVYTDAEGRFAFGHRRRGAVSLRVYPSTDRQKWINVDVAANTENVEVVLDPELIRKVVLQGQMVDAASGAPLPEVMLTLWRGSSGMTHSLKTDEGAFELFGLEPGMIGVEAHAPGHAPLRLGERFFEVGDNELGTLRLAPALDINLLIVDENGEPWEAGGLCVLGEHGVPVTFAISSQQRSTQSAIRGVPLLLGELPAVALTLRIEADGTSREIPFDPRQHAGQGKVVRLTVEKPRAVTAETVIVALLRRGALESPYTFATELEAAMRSEDQVWVKQHFEEILAAGPRSDLVLEATSEGGLPSTVNVSWDPAKQLYSARVKDVLSESLGRSTSSTSLDELPIPIFALQPRMRGRVLSLRLRDGETVLLQRSLTIDAGEDATFVVLAY